VYDEIVKFLSAVTDYEAVNGEWTVDDIADIADTTLLKYLIKLGLVKKVNDISISPKYHTTSKATKYVEKFSWMEKEVEKEEEEEVVIPPDLFDGIVELDEVKELFYMALHADEPVHLALLGDSGTAKSVILYSLERKLPHAKYVDSSLASKMGIAKMLQKYRPRYLLMDEFDKMSADDYNVLLNVMSSGRLVITKATGNREIDIPMKTWVFAAMNTLNIPDTIKERFLTIIRLKEYDRAEALSVMGNILLQNKVIEPVLASYIARKVYDDLGTSNPRVAIQISHMAKTKEEVDRVIELIKKGRSVAEY